jgi:hypothetical protein
LKRPGPTVSFFGDENKGGPVLQWDKKYEHGSWGSFWLRPFFFLCEELFKQSRSFCRPNRLASNSGVNRAG